METHLWGLGITSWEHAIRNPLPKMKRVSEGLVRTQLEESYERLCSGDAKYFERKLPQNERWRIFPEFRLSTAYLDIETFGGNGLNDQITTIALYDGDRISYYVQGENLQEFRADIRNYQVLVTYNGKCFDIPVIKRYFNMRMDQVHIDLRFVLQGLGFKGGLKGCEKQLGIARDELDGVDGFFAVLFWNDYLHNGNDRALDTLLAYNILDAVNLELLMVKAYNLKLRETPFYDELALSEPVPPPNPFQADVETVERISVEIQDWRAGY